MGFEMSTTGTESMPSDYGDPPVEIDTMRTVFSAVDTSSGAFLVIAVLGTVAFATSGVMAAAQSGLDWLGALVLAAVVAVGGGTIRDVVLGNYPISWVDDQWPVLVALGTAVVGIVVLRVHPSADPTSTLPYLAADAVGLGAFVVLGTSIALQHGTSALIAVILGVVTGVGGGVIRDVFSSRTPIIFVGQVYAVAGTVGAVAHVALDAVDARDEITVWVPLVMVVVLRALAVRFDLHLPRVKSGHDA